MNLRARPADCVNRRPRCPRLLYVLAACAFFIAAAGSIRAATEQEQLKAILLLEHEQSSPWTDLLRAGLHKGARDFNYEIETVVAPPGTDQTAAFRNAAARASLVLVATDRFHEILRDNAANFRRIKFGCLDAGIRAPNIMSVTFADEQASFLAGAAAAMLTTATGNPGINDQATIGWLSGEDTPAMRSLFNGFSEGAKLARSDVRVIQALASSFIDKDMAAKKAAWLADAGADVLALAAGAGNPGALSVAADKNLWHVALDGGDNSPHLLGSIVKKSDVAVYEIMKSAASGKFAGKEILTYNLANGGVDFVPAPQFLNSHTPAARDIGRRIGELRHELENGSIKLRSLRARTLCDCLD